MLIKPTFYYAPADDGDGAAPANEPFDLLSDPAEALANMEEDDGSGDESDDTSAEAGEGSGDATDTDDEGDADAGTGDREEDEEEEADEDEDEVEEDDKPVTPTDEEEIVIPDYSDKDYSIEIEDAEGKKLKIEKLSDLPHDFEPKTYTDMLLIGEKLAEKRAERQKDEAEVKEATEKKQEQDERKQATEQYQQQAAIRNKAWDQEISMAQKSGLIPAVKVSAKATEEEMKADPGLKRQAEVFDFMQKENAKRQKEGNPFFLGSFIDGLAALEMSERMQANKGKDKGDVEKRRQAGGRIGKGSPAPTSSSPGGKNQGEHKPSIAPGTTIADIIEQETGGQF